MRANQSPEAKAAKAAYDRARRAANPEMVKAYSKAARDRADPEKIRAYQRSYREKNKERLNARRAEWRKTHKEPSYQKPEYRKEWQKANPEKVAAHQKAWRAKKGRQYMRDYEKKKRAHDPNFRIGQVLRSRVRKALCGNQRTGKTFELLGCDIENFKLYLESKFEEGMSWDNYGSFWEIDHIIPCAIFDLTKEDHQQRCFHFSNQQPLTKTANRRKHTKILQPCSSIPSTGF